MLSDAHSKKFDCGLGNVYVEGTVKGRVTIAAENNVVVTGDLGIANTALGADTGKDNSDIVGLVAQNSVVVYHPVEVTSWTVAARRQRQPQLQVHPVGHPDGRFQWCHVHLYPERLHEPGLPVAARDLCG